MTKNRATIDADIAALDLEPIAFKLCVDEGWLVEDVDTAISEYRAFLQAIRNHPGSIVPSKTMDMVWHHHILDTEKYAEDCQRLFGRYVHHYPYAGIFGPEDAQVQMARFIESQALIRAYLTPDQDWRTACTISV